jgi:hypothetical protein
MKLFLIAATLLGGTFALSATDAGAAVCARGVYRAGCAGPGGAVVARRPVTRVTVPRPVVVVPRPVVVAPRVVCARGVYRAGCVAR